MKNFRIHDAVCDLESREIIVGGMRRRMEPKAAAVLSMLASAQSAAVSRATLLDTCWPGGDGSDEALTQAIAQLRRLFDDTPQSARYIQTVPRFGYRLMGECLPVLAAEPIAARQFSKQVGPYWNFKRIAASAAVLLLVASISAGAAIAFLPNVPPGFHIVRHFIRHRLMDYPAMHG
jgi:DNA-binding winged helix-turn-helix (wHTH) protein